MLSIPRMLATGVLGSLAIVGTVSGGYPEVDGGLAPVPSDDSAVAAAVDFTGTQPKNFFDPKAFQTNVCVPGGGMLQFGQWGFAGIPVPAYREKMGWDFGGEGYVSYGAGHGDPARIIFGAFVAHNQWERRATLVAELKPFLLYRSGWSLSTPVQVSDVPGRRGFGLGAKLVRSWSEKSEWIDWTVTAVSEKFTDRIALGANLWATGDHRWINFRMAGRGLGGRIPHALNFSSDMRAASEWLGSDYDYRRTVAALEWAEPRWRAWFAGGVADGRPPLQELFDLAIDGNIKSIPIWDVQVKDFVAGGVEGRTHVFDDFYVGAFATTADGSGVPRTLWEGGVSVVMAFEALGYEPEFDDWLIRLDFPVYSSEAARYSSRPKWDLGRFMIRINFPILSVGRDDFIRYRYPNR